MLARSIFQTDSRNPTKGRQYSSAHNTVWWIASYVVDDSMKRMKTTMLMCVATCVMPPTKGGLSRTRQPRSRGQLYSTGARVATVLKNTLNTSHSRNQLDAPNSAAPTKVMPV